MPTQQDITQKTRCITRSKQVSRPYLFLLRTILYTTFSSLWPSLSINLPVCSIVNCSLSKILTPCGPFSIPMNQPSPFDALQAGGLGVLKTLIQNNATCVNANRHKIPIATAPTVFTVSMSISHRLYSKATSSQRAQPSFGVLMMRIVYHDPVEKLITAIKKSRGMLMNHGRSRLERLSRV